jgi:queuine tRNA-ribosyltransferase
LYFLVEHKDDQTAARVGIMSTAHGEIETPVFMPVGTQASVKAVTQEMLEVLDARIILGNSYHLALRPGEELIRDLGGLHRFMNWPGPILTDSGGFQVFSLASQVVITDHGAKFRSHIDGAPLELTPERAVEIQENLGADIAMVLDECPPAQSLSEVMRAAVRRSILWAERCKRHHARAEIRIVILIHGASGRVHVV